MILLVAALSFAPQTAPAKPPRRMIVRRAAREEIPLGVKRRVRLKVDAMAGVVEMRTGPKTAKQIVEKLREEASAFCPDVSRRGKRVRLECKTRQLTARVVWRDEQRVLQITKLKGFPLTRDDSKAPQIAYVDEKSCPDPLPKAGVLAGECHMLAGRTKSAARAFKRALRGQDRAHAALRLGDLALRRRDVPRAAGWYTRAGRMGPFGRLARARLCELEGTCFSERRYGRRIRALNPDALPGNTRDEMVLRWARAEVFAGRPLRGAKVLLVNGLKDAAAPNPCRHAPRLCHKIALEALRERPTNPSADALSLYLALPEKTKGPYAHELSWLAATTAEELGAPRFAASILASTTHRAKKKRLAGHLARTAELYLDGGDQARARVVLSYAREKFKKRETRARFVVLEDRLFYPAPPEVEESDAPPELADPGLEELRRAQALLAKKDETEEGEGEAQ